MSRYSGPQQRGAEKQARAEKRRQAEVRQRAEQKREARRRAEAAKWQDEPELTEAELDSLVYAVAAIRFGELVAGLSPRWTREPQQPTGRP